jgi:hypothetical protein
MGNVILGLGLLVLLLSIFVLPCYAGLRTHVRRLPAWLPIAIIALVVLAFALVPFDSQAAVSAFRPHP